MKTGKDILYSPRRSEVRFKNDYRWLDFWLCERAFYTAGITHVYIREPAGDLIVFAGESEICMERKYFEACVDADDYTDMIAHLKYHSRVVVAMEQERQTLFLSYPGWNHVYDAELH